MKCPKCSGRMRVTNVYAAGEAGAVKRLECRCGVVATVVAVLVNTDPAYGAGAATLARRPGMAELVEAVRAAVTDSSSG